MLAMWMFFWNWNEPLFMAAFGQPAPRPPFMRDGPLEVKQV